MAEEAAAAAAEAEEAAAEAGAAGLDAPPTPGMVWAGSDGGGGGGGGGGSGRRLLGGGGSGGLSHFFHEGPRAPLVPLQPSSPGRLLGAAGSSAAPSSRLPFEGEEEEQEQLRAHAHVYARCAGGTVVMPALVFCNASHAVASVGPVCLPSAPTLAELTFPAQWRMQGSWPAVPCRTGGADCAACCQEGSQSIRWRPPSQCAGGQRGGHDPARHTAPSPPRRAAGEPPFQHL